VDRRVVVDLLYVILHVACWCGIGFWPSACSMFFGNRSWSLEGWLYQDCLSFGEWQEDCVVLVPGEEVVDLSPIHFSCESGPDCSASEEGIHGQLGSQSDAVTTSSNC